MAPINAGARLPHLPFLPLLRLLPLLLAALGALPGQAEARQAPTIRRLAVQAATEVSDLRCDPRPSVARPAASVVTDPMEIPTGEFVEEMAPVDAADGAPMANRRSALPPGGPARVAIWGDSHLAANFFSETVSKLINIPAEAPLHALIPASMAKPGIRLSLRQSCVSPQWKIELAYLGGEAAAAPGPGMVNMFSDQAGSTVAWDVRRPAAQGEAARGEERVRLLYQQTGSPIVVAIGIDGQPEKEVTLDGAAGPAILELVAEQPISQVKLRLVDGRLRLHGLELMPAQESPLVMDVFGYPGATVASWKNANFPYFASWFGQRDYQLVMLEFGTNEGNVKPFDSGTYRRLLSDSVQNLRKTFPNAACMLIAPGDRGVLVPRSANLHTKKSAGGKGRNKHKPARKPPAVDLYQYSRIHAEIGRIQAAVALDAGCGVWSMQTAMGGPGSAYNWARQSPPLMARDLIHFTVAGYQRLGQQFVKDMGWSGAPTTP